MQIARKEHETGNYCRIVEAESGVGKWALRMQVHRNEIARTWAKSTPNEEWPHFRLGTQKMNEPPQCLQNHRTTTTTTPTKTTGKHLIESITG